jgi:hypothetical protein
MLGIHLSKALASEVEDERVSPKAPHRKTAASVAQLEAAQ